MAEFFVAMAIAGILEIIPIVLIDIYSNYRQNQITYKRKRWTMNAKRHSRSTPSSCLGLDMGLACGCSFALFKEYCQAVKKSKRLKYEKSNIKIWRN